MVTNKLSKYNIIVKEIKDKIFCGELKNGDRVPSENQLSKDYDTSRVTARKALAVLNNEGYIFAVQGKGHYVCPPQIYRYQYEVQNNDCSLDIKLISVEIANASTEIRIHMQYHTMKKIVEIKNYLLRDDEIIGYVNKYVPYDSKKPILEKEFHYINSEEKSSNNEQRHVNIKALAADESIAEILQVDIGYPLLKIETKTMNQNNEILSYEKSYFLGDKYKIIGE
jgi:GntR family transcriptional regulator